MNGRHLKPATATTKSEKYYCSMSNQDERQNPINNVGSIDGLLFSKEHKHGEKQGTKSGQAGKQAFNQSLNLASTSYKTQTIKLCEKELRRK